MNKAEKRLAEVKAVSIIYSSTISQVEWTKERSNSIKETIKAELELNKNADIAYYKNQIEELEVETKAYEKIAEHLLKLM